MVEANAPTANPSDSFSLLPDPISDRPLTDAECPKMINKNIEDSLLWPDGELIAWRVLKDFLAREGPLQKPQIMRILRSALALFSTEANLVQIEEPICVVGDIHG